jgi:flagellar assembly protein FliH
VGNVEEIGVSSRVWRRAEATLERVVLGVGRARNSVEKPTLVSSIPPESAASAAQIDRQSERIADLEEQLRRTSGENTDLRQQLSALRSELQEAYRKAEQRGYEAGMREASAKIHQSVEDHARAWKAATDEMLRANEAKLHALRSEISDMVLAAVAKVIGEQLANPSLVRASTEQLLRESGAGAPLRVLLAPLQHEQLTKAGGAQLAWFRDHRLEIGADERVQYGGCILETPQGIVDGRYEVQLEKLRQILAPHYGAAR